MKVNCFWEFKWDKDTPWLFRNRRSSNNKGHEHNSFTIETDSTIDSCYIIKAEIDKNKSSIRLKNKISLPKPAGWEANDNAGFESIAFLPVQKKLITFFEKNRDTEKDKIYLLDTFLMSYDSMTIIDPLFFRLTDIAPNDESTYAYRDKSSLSSRYNWI